MPMRVVASRGRVVFSVRCRRSPSAALMTKSGSGTHWWIHRPSAQRNTPFGARGSLIQLW